MKLRPPVKPSRFLDRNLSSWVDWKTVEVAVLGFVPVFLGLVGLLAAAGGPIGLLELVHGPVGLPGSAGGPLGRSVTEVALEGVGGHTDSAAMVALASSRSWCFFWLTRATTSFPPRLTVPSQWLINWSKIPTWRRREARCERMDDKRPDSR